jgi:MGT family glycosyltransferase
VALKILFVVPPWTGHVNPTVSVARRLAANGHEVAWAGHTSWIGRLLPEGARVFDLGDVPWSALALERSRTMRHLESLRFLWESLLVPLARQMVAPVTRVIDAWAPDLVVVDQQAIGGALAVRRLGRRWASFCTTSASVIDTLAILPKVKAWVGEQLGALEDEAGLARIESPDLSPESVIVFSTDALVGATDAFPSHYHFVGPSIADRPDATPFPWERLDPARKKIYVSLGTVSLDRERRFYDLVAEAAIGAPWQLVMVAPPGWSGGPPDAIVQPRVPQLALLRHVHAVVSHGGHNTVCETLARGLPLVVTPIRDDQPVIADQVTKAGAGVRLHFGRLTPRSIREAIDRVLTEPSYTAAAERVRDSFARAGGDARAAQLLEQLGTA